MHDREHIKRSRLDLSSIQIEENGIRYEIQSQAPISVSMMAALSIKLVPLLFAIAIGYLTRSQAAPLDTRKL